METPIYLDTTIDHLFESDRIDRMVLKACQSARPPLRTAGDIMEHYRQHGNFASVPGCRRAGRISDILQQIALMVEQRSMPSEMQPTLRKRVIADRLGHEADFDFLTEEQREEILAYRNEHDYLPMFKVLRCYLTRKDASRNDIIMASVLGFDADPSARANFAAIGQNVNLSRERVRQIALTYELPEQLSLAGLWKRYFDHKTYYADDTHPSYKLAAKEVAGLTFAAFATVIHRTTMLHNVDDRYLARRGWINEIGAWVDRLNRLAAMPRPIDSRISIEGLAMGGTLDIRMSSVVLRQIVPAFGFKSDDADAIILPKNR